MEDVAISVYPNPARDYVNITLPPGSELIEFTDVLGRVVRSVDIHSFTVGLRLSLYGIEEGIYNMIVHTKDGNISSRKIVVSR